MVSGLPESEPMSSAGAEKPGGKNEGDSDCNASLQLVRPRSRMLRETCRRTKIASTLALREVYNLVKVDEMLGIPHDEMLGIPHARRTKYPAWFEENLTKHIEATMLEEYVELSNIKLRSKQDAKLVKRVFDSLCERSHHKRNADKDVILSIAHFLQAVDDGIFGGDSKLLLDLTDDLLAQLNPKRNNFSRGNHERHSATLLALRQIMFVLQSISPCCPVPAVLHEISICILEGKDLPAKDSGGFFRRPFSDPYYIVNFKGQRTQSEIQKKTLNQVWHRKLIELGHVKESETELLEISIFDHNYLTTDNFIGVVRVTAGELHALGLGEHKFWFKLGNSKKEESTQESDSGKILIQFSIKESLQDFVISHQTSSQSNEAARDPQNSYATRVDTEKNGMTSMKCVDVGREVAHAVDLAREENSVPLSTDPDKNTPHDTAAIRETAADEKATLVPTNKGDLDVVGRFLRTFERCRTLYTEAVATTFKQAKGTADSHDTSDGDNSSASEAEFWIWDKPFGSRGRLLTAIGALKRGQVFADDYKIAGANFAGRPHLCLAEQKFGNREPVILKFYSKETTMDNAVRMHSMLSGSDYVCRIVQTLRASQTGHPSCIAFEKGTQTLRDWLLGDRPMFDRKWCLCQILTGLMEIHAEGVVHSDLKPSNMVFFPESVKWKFIDFDGAQKTEEGRTVCFTPSYAAPEILQGWKKKGELPVAQPSSDIWSLGIIAYEVLTGIPMFDHDLSHDEIFKLIMEGEVEQKLSLIPADGHREAISNFLKRDPSERWSAVEALQHPVFYSDPQTTWTQF